MPENHVTIRRLGESGDQAREIAVIGLDFGEGIRFEPVKLLESWEKARREAKESLNGLGRQVLRIGVRKPRLAMVSSLVIDFLLQFHLEFDLVYLDFLEIRCLEIYWWMIFSWRWLAWELL